MDERLENFARARGQLPALLMLSVNPELDGVECGWCGWKPPMGDIAGALAYCTQKGLACPNCRSVYWDDQEGDMTWEDMFFSLSYYKFAQKPAIRGAYALSWARHCGDEVDKKELAKLCLDASCTFGVEKAEQFHSPKQFRLWIYDESSEERVKLQYLKPTLPSKFWGAICRSLGLDSRKPEINRIPVYITDFIIGKSEITAERGTSSFRIGNILYHRHAILDRYNIELRPLNNLETDLKSLGGGGFDIIEA